MAQLPALFRHLTVGAFLALLMLGVAAWSAPADAQPRPDLSTALLTVDDLPAGWQPVDAAELDLDDIGEVGEFDPAELGLDPNGLCAGSIEPYAAILSAQPPAFQVVVFQRGELGPFIAQVVIALPPGLADQLVEPGTADFEAIVDACEQELAAAGEDADLATELGISIRSTPLKLPQIGDESIAARTDIGFGFFGTSLLSLFSRRGDAVSLLFMLADPITATESAGLFEQLGRRADARLMQALAGS